MAKVVTRNGTNEYLQRVISGGQTGADQGALAAAKRFGIETGGWAPKGFKTEKGFQELTLKNEYGLIECPTSSYHVRTEYNVKWGDLTVIFAAKPGSVGTKCTVHECQKHNKPFITIPLIYLPKEKANQFRLKLKDESQTEEMVVNIIQKLRRAADQPLVMNVAGNRASVSPGIYHFVDNYIFNILTLLKNR